MPSKIATGLIGRFAARLRFPQLFAVAAILFVVDLFLPDFLPFVDEILLGLLTALLASLQKPEGEPPAEPRPVKDVTPKG